MAHFLFLSIVAVSLCLSNSFTIAPQTIAPKLSSTRLGLFGGLKDAFKNDDSLNKASNPGLKNGPAYNDNVTVNGMPVQGAVVGQKLTVVAGRARVKIPVNCQKGDCGTCMVKMNGKKVKGKYRMLLE